MCITGASSGPTEFGVMREWNLPSALVDHLDAVAEGCGKGTADPVLAYLGDFADRTTRLYSILSGLEGADQLLSETDERLQSLRTLVDTLDYQGLLESGLELEKLEARWRSLALCLPRATGDTSLDELFATALRVDDGGRVDPESTLTRLASARESVLGMEHRAATFARRYPDEVELEKAMVAAVIQLKEALGAIFLWSTGDESVEAMGEAAQLIAQGGATAVACLQAMDSVAEARREYSSDPVIELLFQAVKANDFAPVDAAVLDESRRTLLSRLRELERVFAPHSWRESYLKPAIDALEGLERRRELLVAGLENGELAPEDIVEFESLALRFQELEENALAHRPSLESLPEEGRFRDLMTLLGAVYERRAPVAVARSELSEFVEALRDMPRHSGHLESSAAAGELSEAIELLSHTVHHGDVAHFPVLWDRLQGPVESFARVLGDSG